VRPACVHQYKPVHDAKRDLQLSILTILPRLRWCLQ
jgi:hypothetical protein